MNKFKLPETKKIKGNITTETPLLFSDIMAFVYFMDRTHCYYTDMKFYPTVYSSKEYTKWFDEAWKNLALNVVGEDVFEIVMILRKLYLRNNPMGLEILKRCIITDFEQNIIFDDFDYKTTTEKTREIFYNFRKYEKTRK